MSYLVTLSGSLPVQRAFSLALRSLVDSLGGAAAVSDHSRKHHMIWYDFLIKKWKEQYGINVLTGEPGQYAGGFTKWKAMEFDSEEDFITFMLKWS